MKLYHFPSPNPQKVTFALAELGLAYDLAPVDLVKGEHKTPAFLAINPFGRVPALEDEGRVLWESHAIVAYLGDKTGRLWPTAPAGRADALKWLFFLSQHVMPPAGQVALRIRSKLLGIPLDDAAVAQGEKALADPLRLLDGELARHKWLLGSDFSLVDCAYCPVLNIIDKAGFGLAEFPKVADYLGALRARPAWQKIPKLPGVG